MGRGGIQPTWPTGLRCRHPLMPLLWMEVSRWEGWGGGGWQPPRLMRMRCHRPSKNVLEVCRWVGGMHTGLGWGSAVGWRVAGCGGGVRGAPPPLSWKRAKLIVARTLPALGDPLSLRTLIVTHPSTHDAALQVVELLGDGTFAQRFATLGCLQPGIVRVFKRILSPSDECLRTQVAGEGKGGGGS